MKRYRSLFAVLLVMGLSGSPVAAQTSASTSPQPVPPVTGPAPERPSSQAQIPTGASSPGATAANLGPIVATGDSVAYVSAESTGHPVVFIGSDFNSYGIIGTFSNHSLGFRTNNIARMFIDTSGNVGIGTMGPGYRLDVSGDANITGTYRVNGAPISATSNWTQSGNNIFYTTGNVGIGTIAPSQGRLHVAESAAGGAAMYGRALDGDGVSGFSFTGHGVSGDSPYGYGVYGVSQNGNGWAGYFWGKVQVTGLLCAANIPCSSDIRLKQNITPLSYGLREVLHLRPAKWEWKSPSTAHLNFGLIAQDVEPVLPELILRNVDTNGSLGLHYTGLIPILINAIQEQQDTISALDARIRTLEQALDRLRPAQ